METKPRCNGGASLFWMDGGQGKNKRHHLKEVGQWVKARRKADKNLRNYLKEVGHSVKVRRKADKDERNHFKEAGFE